MSKVFLLGIFFLPSIVMAQQENDFKVVFKNLKPVPGRELFLLGYGASSHGTLMVDYTPGKTPIVQQLPFLASPQPDGFYFLQSAYDEKTFNYKEYYGGDTMDSIIYNKQETALIIDADPLALMNRVSDFEVVNDISTEIQEAEVPDSVHVTVEEKNYEETSSVGLLYVLPGFITLSVSEGGYAGGAHPNYYGQELTSVLSKGEHTGKADFSSQFTPAEWETIRRTLFFRGVGRYFDDAGEEPAEAFNLAEYSGMDMDKMKDEVENPVNVDEPFFVLERKEGFINLTVTANAPAAYAQSGDYSFTTSTPGGVLKTPFAGYNKFPIGWEALKKIEPQLIDAFVSPNNNIVVILYSVTRKPNHLKIIEVQSGKMLLEIPFENSPVVMAEWATGKGAERWSLLLSQHAVKK